MHYSINNNAPSPTRIMRKTKKLLFVFFLELIAVPRIMISQFFALSTSPLWFIRHLDSFFLSGKQDDSHFLWS